MQPDRSRTDGDSWLRWPERYSSALRVEGDSAAFRNSLCLRDSLHFGDQCNGFISPSSQRSPDAFFATQQSAVGSLPSVMLAILGSAASSANADRRSGSAPFVADVQVLQTVSTGQLWLERRLPPGANGAFTRCGNRNRRLPRIKKLAPDGSR